MDMKKNSRPEQPMEESTGQTPVENEETLGQTAADAPESPAEPETEGLGASVNDADNAAPEDGEMPDAISDELAAILEEESGGEPGETAAEAEDADEDEKTRKKRKRREMSRKFRYGGMATAMSAVVIVVVILINVVAGILNDRFPITWDLTKDKTFTLSQESIDVAKNVKEKVDIKVFAEEKLFTSQSTESDELNTILRQFYETTKQYNTQSGGKVVTQYLDLNADPTLAQAYADYDISAGSILFQCGEKYRVISVNDLVQQETSGGY